MMKRELTTEQMCAKAMAYCSLAEHCAHEVRDKVLAWGGSGEQAELIIAYLEQEMYIDEARYARAYAHDKVTLQHWSKQKVQMMLHSKGIAGTYVQEALEQLNEDDYLSELGELITHKMAAIEREAVKKGWDEESKQARLMRFLLGRGYRYREINEALKMVNNGE